MERRFVGILVNSSVYQGIPSGLTKHEAIQQYEEAGSVYGLTPCFFRLQDIRLFHNTVKAFVKNDKRYTRKTIEIPQVIHNRSLYTNPITERKIKLLVQSGKQVFNGWNRYSKLYIHNLLMEAPSLRPHLPGTVRVTHDTLKNMMTSYSSLILKPDSGSIGRGVMKLDRTEEGWLLTHRTRSSWSMFKFSGSIPLFLRRKLYRENYIVQQRLPLATYDGRPFDLRVSVQRTDQGDWKLIGIAGKVAARNTFVTNIAQGGTVYRLKEILRQYPELDSEQVYRDIEDFCLRAVNHLSGYLPHLADVGFDIGLTSSGFPLFVECNGRDLRISFLRGNMPEEWKATYANPIGYARYLLDGNMPPS